MEREVRYCTTEDGVRAAHTVTGEGPANVVMTDPGASHAQLEWSHPPLGRLHASLSEHNTLIRFDPRGVGLSDRVLPPTAAEWLRDLETVVTRLALDEFALTAMPSACRSAIAFAASHPGQVRRLVLINGFARGRDVLERPVREGWDVKNVVVIVPLRAYSAKANILPEQTLGRGLRRMSPPASGDIREQVIVIEHSAFKDFWNKELREEGLDMQWVPVEQVRPQTRTVVVDKTRLDYDIDVAILTPALVRSVARLDELDVDALDAPLVKLPERSSFREDTILYTGRHMFTLEVVDSDEFEREFPVEPSGYLSVLVRLIERETRLTGQFARLAPLLKCCIETRLFGQPVSMDDEIVMRVLNRPDVKKALFETLVLAINDVSIEEQAVALEPEWIKASDTNAFTTTRRCVEGRRTVFNLVPCDSQLEIDFAEFLESPEAEDVLAYFKNETAVHFDVEYQGVAGGLRKYRPDFIVRAGDGVTYIVETKGHEDLEVERKDLRARRWCQDASNLTGARWEFLKVPEGVFRAYPVRTFGQLRELLYA